MTDRNTKERPRMKRGVKLCPRCDCELIIKDFEDYQLGRWSCPKCGREF